MLLQSLVFQSLIGDIIHQPINVKRAKIECIWCVGKNREEMIAGFLHNVLDNPRVTMDYLRAAGVDESVLATLK